MQPTTHLLLSLLALSPSLVSAADQAQKPLGDQAKDWLSAAKQYVPTAFPTVPGLTVPTVPAAMKSPISASASKIAALKVHRLTNSNWDTLITPPDVWTKSAPPNEWMVFVTGGNKTCGGHCHNLEVNWNETAAIFSADPTAPKLGVINCDEEPILCATWTARPPTIWHIQRRNSPANGVTTDIYVNYLNITHTRAPEIVALHTNKKYEEGMLYTGAFHPFDGWLAQYGLSKPVGYVMYGFGLLPSWTLMLIISIVSRTFLSRRAGNNIERERAAARHRMAANAQGPAVPRT